MQTILTIAGFDPSSGAGVTADLATIAAHGYFGTSAITALTVQSTLGVRATHPVEAGILAHTLNCLVDDLPPAGIKIGMLGTEANVRVVITFLRRLREAGRKPSVVLDPVIRSSTGAELLSPAGVEPMRRELLWLVDWVTPNTAELAVLTNREVSSREQMESAAMRLAEEYRDLGVAATGGHLDTPDDMVIEPGGKAGEWMPGTRLDSRATHGTGCAYSTALLCGLVDGLRGFAAARRAKEFVAEAIRRAEPLGGGNGPMNLLWPISNGHS